MAQAVKVQMPDGQVIWARVETGPSDVAASDAIKKLDIEGLTSSIKSVSHAVWEAAQDLTPDTVGVEFGLELAVKSGQLVSILAEASGKASLKVSMSWSNGATPAQVAGGAADD